MSPNTSIYLLVLLSLAATFNVRAQMPDNYCATDQPEEALAWLRAWQADPDAFPTLRRSDDPIMVPIKVHIVGTDDGGGYYRLDVLMGVFCELNEQFAPTGFHFYMAGGINYIDNSLYYAHDWFQGSNMMYNNNFQNVVNVYFVSDPSGACGYYTWGPDAVAIAKSCGGLGNSTVAHELGHYFSLPHTFRGWEGSPPPIAQRELVDRSNCNTAGDGFCGTGPDYANYRWNCPITGPFTDPNGDEFVPDGTFYMSYSNDACTSRFSDDQQAAMQANLAGPRADLLSKPAPPLLNHSMVEAVEPEDGAVNTTFNYTVLKWTKDPTATSYQLSIGLNPTMSAISQEVILTDTFFIAPELPKLRKHYWRVKPISPGNTCTPYSVTRSFTTGEVASGLFSFDQGSEGLLTFPNPLPQGMPLTVQFSAEQDGDMQLSLMGLDGRVHQSTIVRAFPGENNMHWAINGVPEGLYLLELSPAGSALFSASAVRRVNKIAIGR